MFADESSFDGALVGRSASGSGSGSVAMQFDFDTDAHDASV
jgi:hypothetical protein